MSDINIKIKELLKNKKEKIVEIADALLNELDNMDNWTWPDENTVALKHRRFNLKLRSNGICRAYLEDPSYTVFPLIYKLKIRKKMLAICHYRQFQTLSFVADVASGKYPLYVVSSHTPAWLEENDPKAEGYIIKSGSFFYFTDEALAMAYKLAHD